MERSAIRGRHRPNVPDSATLHPGYGLLQRYIRHEDVVTFRRSEIASITFPLKLQSVTQVDSGNSAAVQLADVMIGAAIEAANTLRGHRVGALDA